MVSVRAAIMLIHMVKGWAWFNCKNVFIFWLFSINDFYWINNLFCRSRRSHLGYGSSRGALSGHEPREFYSGGRQGMDYDIGNLYVHVTRCRHSLSNIGSCFYSFFVVYSQGFMRSNDGGMYPSSFGGGYMSRGSDVCWSCWQSTSIFCSLYFSQLIPNLLSFGRLEVGLIHRCILAAV